ncbi:hypothetical protein GCM10007862_24050 [Dyella lipolytica]|nr:hypothetical protein GCM10007862_24050 [Dyella lipolytica]
MFAAQSRQLGFISGEGGLCQGGQVLAADQTHKRNNSIRGFPDIGSEHRKLRKQVVCHGDDIDRSLDAAVRRTDEQARLPLKSCWIQPITTEQPLPARPMMQEEYA